MPTIRPNLEGGGAEKRTTFRPPWVKDGPCPLPCPPSNPWLAQAKQEKKDAAKNVPAPSPLKKPKEKEVKINVETDKGEEASKPREREVKINIQREKPSEPKAREQEIKVDRLKDGPSKRPDNNKGKEPVTKKVEFKEVPEEYKMEAPKAPPLPPPPPMAPAPPPPPPVASKPLSKEKAAKIEALRSRPRRRPDWVDMMKEVEQGIKLKHVQCNDRSAPVLPVSKAKGQFVYESEKQNSHNQLLKEIQGGVRLKKVKTNDRSKPILEGLRKFRRQMTIEEIITKSASVADVVAVASEPDELDDIDKVRDDLQSTKQMLALELRNKEALERENKRLLQRLANLEAELEKEKQARTAQPAGAPTKQTRTEEDDKLISRLKEEAAQSAAMTKEMEDKYHKTAEELDLTRAKLESAWLKNAQLEMELKSKGKYNQPLMKQPSSKKIAASDKKNQSSAALNKEPEESDTVTETESEEEEEDEVNENPSATQEEREARELKLLNNKLKTLRDKKIAANNEKKHLKSQLSKLQHVLKEEKKKYKLLQKEVEKMASLMKDVEGDDEAEDDRDDDEDEEDEEETETETESEEEEVEEEIPEDASHHEKVRNLNSRIRAFETLLTRAKKGNYLLKANIERKQDDVNRQKEMSLALQEDLNAVLSELG